jgi:hypothetical protein
MIIKLAKKGREGREMSRHVSLLVVLVVVTLMVGCASAEDVYKQQIRDWKTPCLDMLDLTRMQSRPVNPSNAVLSGAEQFHAKWHEGLQKLVAIHPPAEQSEAFAGYVQDYVTTVNAVDEWYWEWLGGQLPASQPTARSEAGYGAAQLKYALAPYVGPTPTTSR